MADPVGSDLRRRRVADPIRLAIIGGLESPLGVIAGGLFLGIVESLTALYIGPTYADVASFPAVRRAPIFTA